MYDASYVLRCVALFVALRWKGFFNLEAGTWAAPVVSEKIIGTWAMPVVSEKIIGTWAAPAAAMSEFILRYILLSES